MTNEKERFIGSLKGSLDEGNFIRIKFSKYKGDDKEFENIFVTRINTVDGEKLSFNFKYKTRDIVKNYDIDKGIWLAGEILGKDFFSATLFTTKEDISIDYSKKRVPMLLKKKPTYKDPEIKPHNKEKSRFVNSSALYFQRLGITDKQGKVKADRYDKFRQVDKFIEIIDSLYRASQLDKKEAITITDMGSGKSYLTFAVYDHFKNALHKNVKMKGIEQREELIKLSNMIANECGFADLKFEAGTIDNLKEEKTDIVIALHACDTATDDAIVKALKSEAEIILLAPCCQKYLRKRMTSPERLRGLYKHGILEERLAVSVTDGLRALVLEHFGYQTKVFEFISSEHTARNTMITAVKKNDRDESKLKEIDIIKTEFTLEDFYLDKKLLL